MSILFPTYAEALEYISRHEPGFVVCPVCDPIMGNAWRVTIGY